MNRKRRGQKTGKKIPKGLLLLSSLFLCGIIFFVLFLYHSNQRGRITAPPLFEEAYFKSSDLHNRIYQIDNLIYESLFQKGVDERDIFFTDVKHRFQGEEEWDYTELLIKLATRDSALRLRREINSELSKLKPEVTIINDELSDREIVCHIYALGLYTHKIRLAHKEYTGIKRKGLPKIAIIIDDMGYDRKLAESFMDYDLPLCLSFLPLAPFTESVINEANKRGREVLLHLPMEPKGYPRLNPGPGALLLDMDSEEIEQRIEDFITKVPGIKGVNNHMGSSFTERYDKMEIVLRELKKRNLFYIDSRTTNRTVAFNLAKKMGVPTAKKNVFLDNDLSEKAIKLQMERLLGIARYSGSAIGIGHPHKQTLRILYDYLDQLKTEYDVVPVSELVS
jgi:polysaccharide deacetylase 2 family uncharacterized protein YibQ